MLITHFIPEKIKYDGEQLNSLFAYKQNRCREDSLLAFLGEADVKAHLVDYEDKLADDFIKAEEMLHFILTIHGNDLTRARLWQLLLVQHTLDRIVEQLNETMSSLISNIYRSGDDIYIILDEKHFKLTVSIATVSANQKELVHLGINVSDKGAPVPTTSLSRLEIDPHALANAIMDSFTKEYTSVHDTLYKVVAVS